MVSPLDLRQILRDIAVKADCSSKANLTYMRDNYGFDIRRLDRLDPIAARCPEDRCRRAADCATCLLPEYQISALIRKQS